MTLRIAAGVVVGGILGYGWYRLVGCRTGACPITANPWISSAYGALLGLLTVTGGR